MTYSIIARDPATQQMGVATQTQAFAVGSSVPWAQPGYGVVATQSVAEPLYGELGLDLLRGGLTADEALTAMRSIDPQPERRQVAMVDTRGNLAVYTGDACVAVAGHATGFDCAALANMAAGPEVWTEMVAAFERSTGTLATRLLDALEAGQAAGGDVRGQRSAAIVVVRAERSGRPWKDQLIDLRVDRHPDAVAELRRLAEFNDAYQTMVHGFELALGGEPERGLESFGRVPDGVHGEPDHLMYLGLTQVAAGLEAEAERTFSQLARTAPQFIDLVRTFPSAKLFHEHEAALARVLPSGR